MEFSMMGIGVPEADFNNTRNEQIFNIGRQQYTVHGSQPNIEYTYNRVAGIRLILQHWFLFLYEKIVHEPLGGQF